MLPVEGRWVSLGFTAEHHLSAILARLKGKHHTARLFGERRPHQDSWVSWVENQQNCISFDVLDLKTNFYIFLLVSRFRRLTVEGGGWKTVVLEKSQNHNKIYVWHGSVGHVSRAYEHFSF